MDGRIALAPGAVLNLETATGYTLYTIHHEVGRGGSCIVYDASYTDNLGNFKLVRIKESYPHVLRISRNKDNILEVEARDADAFAAAKERLRSAYQRNHDLFMVNGLTNTVANTSDIYEANGTVYIVSVYMNGRTFAEYQGETLHACISLLIGAAKVLQHIHDAGYLYLDLKPDNILTLEGSLDLVQLFDFDSMIYMEELTAAIQTNNTIGLRTSYTKGYASLEQQTGKLRQLGRYSDIYSLGAVLFYALWHKTPSAFDCDPDTEYDYSHMAYSKAAYQDRLFPALTVFFHKTLASYYADRYQSADEAITQLQIILRLSDAAKPWVHSSSISAPVFFAGRDTELEAMEQLLHSENQHMFNLYGMGGIGKSTLTRAYLTAHQGEYGAVLWLYADGNMSRMLCDDHLVQVNTVARLSDESQEEYLERKLRVLSEIAAEQRVLVVVDNVRKEYLDDLQVLGSVGWDVLLISRSMLAEGLCPALCVEELPPEALAQVFQRYAHLDITEEQDKRDFIAIANTVYGHTLTMELLGRQIARSYLTLHEAANLVAEAGFQNLPGERIDYVHDQNAMMAPLSMILDKLIEIDRFSNEERQLLQILSAIDPQGIRVSLLRKITTLPNLEVISQMEEGGWLEVASQRIVFHPMIREYLHSWSWNASTRNTLDEMLARLHHQINPLEDQPDLDKQMPENYDQLYELLYVAEQLLVYAKPATPASQLLTFRILMDAPVDADEAVTGDMLRLLNNPEGLEPRCILRLYETCAFMLGRLEYYEDAHDVLKDMKACLKKHPSHYYMSWYHRAKAIILNNQYGREKDKECLKHDDAAIDEARASKHPDARKQLAAVLLNKTQTLLETESKMKRCWQMIVEADELLAGYPYGYEHYHFDCVAAMYYAITGNESEALQHMHRATEHVEATMDSPLSLIDHLVDEIAVAYIQLERYQDAIDTVIRAIELCNENESIRRYREARFDALLFLGRIYAMNGEYTKAEQTFMEAEKHVEDSPYEWRLPLCPKEIWDKAEQERIQNDQSD